MSEARAKLSAYLVSELGAGRALALGHDDLEQAARTAYAAARRDWLARGEPDEPAEPAE
jgi:hypothetical protein